MESHLRIEEQEKLFFSDDSTHETSNSGSDSSFSSSPTLPISYHHYLQENAEIAARLETSGRVVWDYLNSSTFVAWIWLLLPSFVWQSRKKRTLHSTSWLDGLRGVSSFIVFIHHFILVWFPDLNYGYGTPEQNSCSIFQLPGIRIIYAGRGMVCIFFVISGYVLSYGPLRKIRNKEYPQLICSLSSSAFRRWTRLYYPVLVGTFIALLISRHGLAISPWGGPGTQGSFWEQLQDWWWQFVLISNPVQTTEPTTVYSHPYGFQLWTIPREYRGSIVIYLLLLCFAMTTGLARILLIGFAAHYFLWISNWDLYLFVTGMLFAEIELSYSDIAQSVTLTRLSAFVPKYLKRYSTTILLLFSSSLVALSLHLLTFPDESSATAAGYVNLISWTPKQYPGANLTQRFWLCIGAVILVGVFCFCPALSRSSKTPLYQRPFNTAFAQYLADISYALYCIHPHIIFTFGDKIRGHYRDERGVQYVMGFVIAAVVNTGLCLWMADLFWRGVDAKSVTIGKWLAKKCFVP